MAVFLYNAQSQIDCVLCLSTGITRMGHVSVLALENGEHFSFCPTKKIKKF
jgi:hypothetical protein